MERGAWGISPHASRLTPHASDNTDQTIVKELIQIVIVSHDRAANKLLGRWLARNEITDWRYSSRDYDVGEVRNQAVTRFLREDVPKGKRYLLLMDDDMVPVDSTDAILSAEGPLVFCGSAGPFGTRGHYGDGDFGENFCRMYAGLLQRMKYPYFKTHYENGVRVHCDGHAFNAQAKGLGFDSQMIGLVGHQQTCILLPTETDLGWAVAWPHDIGDPDD